jgi:hypothetical protein
MKKVLVVVFVVAFGMSAVANAQVANVSIYFDQDLQYQAQDCPTAPIGTVLQTLYVVADNFGIWFNAIEYQILYPPELQFLGEVPVWPGGSAPLVLGQSPIGITIGYTTPLNAFNQVVISEVSVIWMCEGCPGPLDIPLVVVPHPDSGQARAIEWPNLAPHTFVGMTSLICPAPSTPVHETTWGGIKALYE